MSPRRRISSSGRSSRAGGVVYVLPIVSGSPRPISRQVLGEHASRTAVVVTWSRSGTRAGGPGPGPPSAVVPAGRDRDRRLGGRVAGGRRAAGRDRPGHLPLDQGVLPLPVLR